MSEEAREKISNAKLGKLNPRYGVPAWNKGKKMSDDTKQKVRVARAKQVITLDHRLAISDGLKRAYVNGTRTDIKEKKKFWKGGILAENRRIRNSFEMRLWRESVFQRDNWTCQKCHVRGGKLEAHHIKPFAVFPELRFDLNNGITLCKSCHRKDESTGKRFDLVNVQSKVFML